MSGAVRSIDGDTSSRRTARYVDHVMSMPISLAMRGRHAADDEGRAAWSEVMEVLREVDRVFSTFRPESYVSRLGRGEITLAGCPPEVAEVIALGDQAERESGGAFRIRRAGPDGRMTLDPSGVVKGWAVERAAVHLRALEATDFCLSAGGDMVCRTVNAGSWPGPGVAPAAGAAVPWRIGIEHPHTTDKLIAMIPVFNGAVATSGTAHRGAHLVDARTGEVPSGVASVTVVANSLTWADIDATAAYAQGAEAAAWLETRPGRSGMVVWEDGTTTLFSGPDTPTAA